MLGLEPDFFAFGRKDRSRAGTTADACSDSRTFSATGDGADRRAKARATGDDACITFLRRFGDFCVRFRRNTDGSAVSDNLCQSQLETGPSFHTTGFLSINNAA